MVAFGVTFEFPVVLVALEIAGVLTPAKLSKWRRWAIIGMVLFAAVVTPSSDPFSMLALALPLLLFYEASILSARCWANDGTREGAHEGAWRPLASREQFLADHPYPLDRFQLDALDLLDGGRSVLVSAPTGSGKTVVAEYAVHLALAEGAKVFYTTPHKGALEPEVRGFPPQVRGRRRSAC